jgi:hypothetical protein
MKKIIYLFLTLFSFTFLQNCEDTYAPDLDYVTFEATSMEFGVDPEGTGSLEVKVFTTTLSNAERQFTIGVVEAGTDASGYTVPNFVIVPANSNVGSFTVVANGPDIDPANGNTIEIEITDPDGSFQGKSIKLNLKQVCPYPELILAITFDSYPEEQYWQIYDMDDTLLYEGGPYPDESTLSQKFCLSPGSYQFLMGDLYGDGGGAYTLQYNGATLHASDGDYGAGEVIVITLD